MPGLVVQGPDGKVIQFPEGMSEADVSAAMGQVYGGAPPKAEPQPSAGPSSAGYILGKLATGALNTGAMLTRGNPAEAGLTPGTSETNKLLAGLGPAASNQAVFGTPTPQAPNAASRYAGSVAETIGGNPLLVAAFPGATIASGLGGQVGEDIAGAPGRLAGGLLGGVAGGLLTAGAKALSGVNSLNKIASGLGTSTTLQQAGTQIQKGAQQWLDEVFPGAEKAAWGPVDAAMHKGVIGGAEGGVGAEGGIPMAPSAPGGPPTRIDNFVEALHGVLANSAAGPLAPAMGAAQPRVLGQMAQKLQQTNIIPSDLLGKPTIPSWDNVRAFSSWLGGQIKNPKSDLSSLGDSNLKTLYSALMQDQRAAAANAGAAPAFDNALATSESLRGMREQIAGLVEPGIAPEDAATLALAKSTKGGSRLDALRQQLPDATNELAAQVVRNPQAWAKLAPEAKQALVPDPVVHSAVEAAAQKAAVPTPSLHSLGREMIGGSAGASLGVLLHPFASATGLSELQTGGAGELAGMLAPYAFGAGKQVFQRPSMLIPPAVGLGAQVPEVQ